MKSIYKFFDKLEDRIRGRLSHYPVLYAFLGGIGIVMFWRGVWHTADLFSEALLAVQRYGSVNLGDLPWWDGPLSLLIGSVLLLSTGLFVFDFIGNEIILTGIKGEKKVAEKTAEELKEETSAIGEVRKEVKEMAARLAGIEKKLDGKN